jgi:hypothetical protein
MRGLDVGWHVGFGEEDAPLVAHDTAELQGETKVAVEAVLRAGDMLDRRLKFRQQA